MDLRRRLEGDPPPGGRRDASNDDVPPAVVERAKAALRHRSGGALAALVYDSALDGVGGGTGRVLRFEHPGGWVELVVSPTPSGCAIDGVADPTPSRAEVEPEGSDIRIAQEATAGRFAFPNVPHGLIRIQLMSSPARSHVHTDWVRV